MRHQDKQSFVSLPLQDTFEILQHMPSWGDPVTDEHGKMGGVNLNEIPNIVMSWVNVCNLALQGEQIARNCVATHSLRVNSKELQVYRLFGSVFGSNSDGEPLQSITGAKRAFEALIDVSIESSLKPEDITAAKRLVVNLFNQYQSQGLLALT